MSSPVSEESKDEFNLEKEMADVPDMNFMEKVQVQKPEPRANEYYIKNPGFMDSDRLVSRGMFLNKKMPTKFRFSQTNNPIDNEFLNVNSGSTDPFKPAPHYEEVRKKDVSNGMILSKRRRTVNIETGEFAFMYTDLRKD